jgi:hypothetical protein
MLTVVRRFKMMNVKLVIVAMIGVYQGACRVILVQAQTVQMPCARLNEGPRVPQVTVS